MPHRGMKPPASKKSKGNKLGTVIKIGVAVIAAGVGFYFGFGFVSSWQNKLNEKADKATKNSDGGQLGHIADLYSVLDATDPNRYESKSRRPLPDQDPMPGKANAGRTGAPEPELPVIPAVWTLETDSAKIPEGRVNGMISGTNFVMDVAQLQKSGSAYILSLRQGMGASADREILVYLRLGPGESPLGYSQMISADMKGAKVPQIVKRWKPNPRFAPQQKSYNSGYVMKLELGKLETNVIPGKVYLALPDSEQSVVAGVFKIRTAPAGMSLSQDGF